MELFYQLMDHIVYRIKRYASIARLPKIAGKEASLEVSHIHCVGTNTCTGRRANTHVSS